MPQTFNQPHPNLWVIQSEIYATNSGIFLSNGAACLIDPALLPEEMQNIHRLLQDQRLKPENLVITHYHWDHVFGPDYFPGVRVIAQQASRAVFSGEDAERMQESIKRFESEHQLKRSRPFKIPAAEITFESDLSVSTGEMLLEIIHAPGHSPDQSVIYQPEEGILWAADMLSDLEIPFVYASLADYQATLEKLNRLDIRLLVPGHGQFTSDPQEIRRRFDEDIAYLEKLRQQVEEAVQSGRTLEETQALCAGMRFKHPEDNAHPHKINVKIVYKQMRDAG